MHKKINTLKNKKILICVTGSIAAFKACEVIRLLMKQEAKVQVMMSASAEKFIGKATFAALTNNEVMMCIKPGEHGSTYGGNPLGCKVAMAALEVVKDENLSRNSEILGQKFRDQLSIFKHSLIKEVRGKGLLNAIEVNDSPDSETAWNICLKLKENGLLAKPTHGNIIRFAPPLVINEHELMDCINIIIKTFTDYNM